MEQKENVDAGLGWLQKMIRLKEKHGTVTILTCLLLLLFACYVVFFGLNPRYLLDRMEATRTEQHDDATLRRLQADAEIRTEVQRLMHEVDADGCGSSNCTTDRKTYHPACRSFTAK